MKNLFKLAFIGSLMQMAANRNTFLNPTSDIPSFTPLSDNISAIGLSDTISSFILSHDGISQEMTDDFMMTVDPILSDFSDEDLKEIQEKGITEKHLPKVSIALKSLGYDENEITSNIELINSAIESSKPVFLMETFNWLKSTEGQEYIQKTLQDIANKGIDLANKGIDLAKDKTKEMGLSILGGMLMTAFYNYTGLKSPKQKEAKKHQKDIEKAVKPLHDEISEMKGMMIQMQLLLSNQSREQGNDGNNYQSFVGSRSGRHI